MENLGFGVYGSEFGVRGLDLFLPAWIIPAHSERKGFRLRLGDEGLGFRASSLPLSYHGGPCTGVCPFTQGSPKLSPTLKPYGFMLS